MLRPINPCHELSLIDSRILRYLYVMQLLPLYFSFFLSRFSFVSVESLRNETSEVQSMSLPLREGTR